MASECVRRSTSVLASLRLEFSAWPAQSSTRTHTPYILSIGHPISHAIATYISDSSFFTSDTGASRLPSLYGYGSSWQRRIDRDWMRFQSLLWNNNTLATTIIIMSFSQHKIQTYYVHDRCAWVAFSRSIRSLCRWISITHLGTSISQMKDCANMPEMYFWAHLHMLPLPKNKFQNVKILNFLARISQCSICSVKVQ
jgi:hypothetical protein